MKIGFWKWLGENLIRFLKSPEFEFLALLSIASSLPILILVNPEFFPFLPLILIIVFLGCAHAVYRDLEDEEF